jgi:hypothetical protein
VFGKMSGVLESILKRILRFEDMDIEVEVKQQSIDLHLREDGNET